MDNLITIKNYDKIYIEIRKRKKNAVRNGVFLIDIIEKKEILILWQLLLIKSGFMFTNRV